MDHAATALVLCADMFTVQMLQQSMGFLAVGVRACSDGLTAVRLLKSYKFEAVVVDWQLGKSAALLMDEVRRSPANHTAVTFAIVDGDNDGYSENRGSPTFVLHRPVSPATLDRVLRAAYGLVVRERRRYFRCPVATPVNVVIEDNRLLCVSVNVSEGGIALAAGTALRHGTLAEISFRLPDCPEIFLIETKMRWQNDAGQAGLSFLEFQTQNSGVLQRWLAGKLDETLPPHVAELFRAASGHRA